jgi:hypothetical protein
MPTALNTIRCALLCLVVCLGVSDLRAQPAMNMRLPAAPPVLPPLFVKRLAGAGSFTAYLEITSTKSNSTEKAEPMRGRVVVYDGAVRFALNTDGGWPGGRSLDGPYSLILPAQRIRYTVVEAMDAYAESPLEDLENLPVECTELSPDKAGGKDTTKFRCVVQSGTNTAHEYTLWILPKPGGAPARLETTVGGTNTIIALKNFKALSKADRASLVLPFGLKRYPSEQAMMSELFTRMAALRLNPPFENPPPGSPPGGGPPGGGRPPGGGPP